MKSTVGASGRSTFRIVAAVLDAFSRGGPYPLAGPTRCPSNKGRRQALRIRMP